MWRIAMVKPFALSVISFMAYGLTTAQVCADGGLLTVKLLPLSLAVEAAQAALSTCAGQGFKVSVNVVDRTGTVKVLLVGDGARQFTADFSRRKAYTASIVGVSTSAFQQRLLAMPDAGKGMLAFDPTLVAVGGGLPIVANDEVIAAIGVSGAPDPDKDQACAQIGIDKIKARLN
jgi:uncharacterized protein GlcG (DUF336 family)